jgi:hypothetical protein
MQFGIIICEVPGLLDISSGTKNFQDFQEYCWFALKTLSAYVSVVKWPKTNIAELFIATQGRASMWQFSAKMFSFYQI